MKRYYALFVLLSIICYSYVLASDSTHNHILNLVQENNTISILEQNSFPTDDDEKFYLKSKTFTYFILLIFIIAKFYNVYLQSIQSIRRVIFLNPIFYQSSYVDVPIFRY